jgi:general secretion pathway protein G
MKVVSGLRNTFIVFSLLFIAGCANEERARSEDVLREDLYHMRAAIDQYTQDKSIAPQHLADLVSAGYLHTIPKDPFTDSASTWIEVYEDATDSIDHTHPGISDVHSGSVRISSQGTRYDSW